MRQIELVAMLVLGLGGHAFTMSGCKGDRNASPASTDSSAVLALQAKPLGAPAAEDSGESVPAPSCLQSTSQFPTAPPKCGECLCAATARCGTLCADLLSCMLDNCAGTLSDQHENRVCLARNCDTQISAAAHANLPALSLFNRCEAFCAQDTTSSAAMPAADAATEPTEPSAETEQDAGMQ